MRIAQVVQMDRAGVVGLLDLGGEDGVERPLLQDQLGDPEIDRLGVVVDDVAVLDRLREHQAFEQRARDRVERQIAQLVLELELGKCVVDHGADQLGAQRGEIAGDHPVLDDLGDIGGQILGDLGFLQQGVDDPLAVPGLGQAGGGGGDDQQAGIGHIHILATGIGIAHLDALAGHVALLAIAFVGGGNFLFALLHQGDLDQILDILNGRNAAPLGVRLHVILGKRRVQLLQHGGGDLGGKTFLDRLAGAAGGGFGRLADGGLDLVGTERNGQAIALAETIEAGGDLQH